MKAKALYPDYDGGYGPSDYQPIVNDLGEILIQVDDEDYQGDTRVLIKKDGKFGVLIFGWGSCSGCDSLQSCETVDELEKLINDTQENVKWFDSASDCLDYFKTHDWQGDYSWHQEETKRFVKESIEALETLR